MFPNRQQSVLSRAFAHGIGFRGILRTELYRGGKLIETRIAHNDTVNEGRDLNLNVMFHGTAAITNWYHGLIDNASYTAIAITDTALSHPGWLEYTGYSEGTRAAWTTAAASGQAISNPTAMVFTSTGSATLKGGFLISNSTKGGTGGILWSHALYPTPLVIGSGDIIRNTYTIVTASI